mmetsp:Transcript_11558/g.30901  ORF Transcript_11558/g.30901 Transcript_11558/m.30901 type:complete len:598 (+) Transcript_11558:60-1853(+)
MALISQYHGSGRRSSPPPPTTRSFSPIFVQRPSGDGPVLSCVRLRSGRTAASTQLFGGTQLCGEVCLHADGWLFDGCRASVTPLPSSIWLHKNVRPPGGVWLHGLRTAGGAWLPGAIATALAAVAFQRRGRRPTLARVDPTSSLRRRGRGEAGVDWGASGEPTMAEMLNFVWPVMLTLLASTLQGLIDSCFVGRCGGALQLAALAPATGFLDSFSYLLSFIAIGTLNVLATVVDSEPDKLERLLSRSLIVAAGVGLLAASALALCAHSAVQLCGARGSVIPLAASYVSIRAIGLPFDLVYRVANAGLLATRDSRTGFLVVLLQSVVNGIGDALACPALGLFGAALTTVAAQAVGCAAVLGTLRARRIIRKLQMPTPMESIDFLAVNLPICATLALKVATVQVLSAAATTRGVLAAAAHQITKSLFWVFGLLASESLSSTSQAFLPAPLRSGDCDGITRTLCKLLILGAVGAVATAGLLGVCIACGGLAVFCRDPAVLAAVPVLPLCLCVLATPYAFCLEGAHIAAKRQRWLSQRLMVMTSATAAVFRWGCRGDKGLGSLWCAFSIYLFTRAAWYAWGLWGRKGVLRQLDCCGVDLER